MAAARKISVFPPQAEGAVKLMNPYGNMVDNNTSSQTAGASSTFHGSYKLGNMF